MESLSISKFKATCLAVIERVRQTGQGVLLTKWGKPVAQVLPPPPSQRGEGTGYGCMAGTIHELADIIEPLGPEDWEALR